MILNYHNEDPSICWPQVRLLRVFLTPLVVQNHAAAGRKGLPDAAVARVRARVRLLALPSFCASAAVPPPQPRCCAHRSFEVLAAEGLSFDLQANPHQLAPFAAFLSGRAADAAVPNIIVNHLGSPRLGRGAAEDAVVLADWREGMKALAAHPTVFTKLSMLDFVRKVRIARRGRWLDRRIERASTSPTPCRSGAPTKLPRQR